MPHKVVSVEELYKEGEIGSDLMNTLLYAKTIIQFDTETEASEFIIGFFNGYLMKTYEEKDAIEFPIIKIGPYRDLRETMNEVHGRNEHDPKRKTWFLVPNEKYHEVEKYIDYFSEALKRQTARKLTLKSFSLY